MKKIMSAMLGLSLIVGSASLFAQDAPKKEDAKKEGKKGKGKKGKAKDAKDKDKTTK